jgi:hypothetical protein
MLERRSKRPIGLYEFRIALCGENGGIEGRWFPGKWGSWTLPLSEFNWDSVWI